VGPWVAAVGGESVYYSSTGVQATCFMGFSDNDRRHCRSEVQTSALPHGNEWTSLRTFALL